MKLHMGLKNSTNNYLENKRIYSLRVLKTTGKIQKIRKRHNDCLMIRKRYTIEKNRKETEMHCFKIISYCVFLNSFTTICETFALFPSMEVPILYNKKHKATNLITSCYTHIIFFHFTCVEIAIRKKN